MNSMYRPAWLDIDMDALIHNIRTLKDYLGKTRLLAVVKADAYGLGAVPVAKLYESLGVDYLGVVTLDEAIELRNAGIQSRILNMGPVFPDQADVIVNYSLEQMVYRESVVEAIAKVAVEQQKTTNVHVKVDTGMSRYGVRFDMAAKYIQKISIIPGIKIQGVFSHLAMSDAKDKRFSLLQIERFETTRGDILNSGLKVPLWHMVNSGGTLDLPQAHYDMVRVGLMTYGYFPSEYVRRPFTLKPAMHLRARVAAVRDIHQGDSVGYGRKFIAEKDEKIAVIPIGYADGYSRNLSKIAKVIYKGKWVPVIGGLCMDAAFLKITENPKIKTGDIVTLMGVDNGTDISPHFIADLSGTVSYEVLSTFGRRLPRVYIRNNRISEIINYLQT